MRIIAIANQKGGVGKTTTAQNIATGMAKLGKKVMVIDCDQQRHLTTGCGVPLFEVKKEKQENVQPTLIDVLRKLVEWKDAAIEIFPLNEEGGACVLIPASSELAAFSILFAQDLGKEFLLKEALKTVPDFFDIILLDSPPNLDLVAVNVLVAATDIVIPVQCESYSLNGVEMLIKTVDQATQRLNPALKIMGIVPTMFDGRKRLCKDVRERLKEMFPNKILNTTIRDSVSLAEAPSHGKSIFEYDPKGYGAEDYFQLSKEIINIIEKEEVKNG